MTLSSPHPLMLTKAKPCDVPGWVAQVLGIAPESLDSAQPPALLVVSSDGRWSLARAVIKDADALDDTALRAATERAYRRVLEALTASSAPNPVRAWNAVPSITRSQSPGLDRYMAFNAGRHDAYAHCFSGSATLADALPTASAIGHGGRDLAISVLGHQQPGRGIENPRQVPAFRYSPRYGKTPPSFVRATLLPPKSGETRVLVAGTASVVGEDSQHDRDLHAQLDETYRNLAAIVAAASGAPHTPGAWGPDRCRPQLDRYRSARVYVRLPEDFAPVMRSVSEALPRATQLELVHADICRPELLVEIEGVAVLPNLEPTP